MTVVVRQYEYAESVTRSTFTGSTTFQDKVTLTFSSVTGKNYLIMWGCTLDGSGAVTVNARLRNVTAGNNNGTIGRAAASTDRAHMGGFEYHTGTGASQSFVVNYGTANAGNTVGVQDAWIMALEITSDDACVSTGSGSDFTTTANSYGDHTSLSFTPGSSGDYLIIAMAQVNNGTGASASDVKLTDGTNSYGEAVNFYCGITSAYQVWGTMVKATLSGAQTWKIQGKSTNGGTTTVRRGGIVALRLDKFPNYFYAESRGSSTTTSSTFQDKVTLSPQTLFNTPHHAISMGILGVGGTTQVANSRLTIAGTGSGNQQVRTIVANGKVGHFKGIKYTPTAVSDTLKTQYSSDATNTASFTEASMFLFQTTADNFRRGSSRVDKVMRGSSVVTRIYRGATQAWGF